MNISILTDSLKRVRVEQDLPDIPKELSSVILDPEYTFYLMGYWGDEDSFDFSNDQLYKILDNKIEKTEFTGEIYFGDIFFLDGDRDLNLIYKVVFIDGNMREIKIHTLEYQDNLLRKNTIDLLVRRIKMHEILSSNVFFRFVYKPYQQILYYAFLAVRRVTLMIFKSVDAILEYIHRILTPL